MLIARDVSVLDDVEKQKPPAFAEGFFGRSEMIRTSGPCLPKTVLYQAELHSDGLCAHLEALI